MSSLLNMDKLPIEIQEHIWSYVDDISLIPNGLSKHFWIKYASRNSLYRVMFASWEKSCRIIKDFDRLKEKREIIAVLDWKHMYVGTLADITITRCFLEYKMKKEVIAAAGRTGLCMLVEAANMEDESYLDISPICSTMEDHYTGEFTYTGYKLLKSGSNNNQVINNIGMVGWHRDNNYCVNNILYKVLHDLFKLYNVNYNLKTFKYSQDGDKYVKDRSISEFRESGFDEGNDANDCDIFHKYYKGGYGIDLPILSQSLVYTKDPLVFEEPHVLQMLHRRNICTVKDLHGSLNAFIVCLPSLDELMELLPCMGNILRYYISDKGNIYFEKSKILKEYNKRYNI